MRGNRKSRPETAGEARSIPAHAGQPIRKPVLGPDDRVYPRACGATPADKARQAQGRGLSPRMRGNQLACARHHPVVRSIPAHAGQPDSLNVICPPCWVYPRACGATATRIFTTRSATGLSPRMRGNRGRLSSSGLSARSIPAHAGQPRSNPLDRQRRWVYPRACGATGELRKIQHRIDGPSPRMRGNLSAGSINRVHFRSIPAHAGQPSPLKCLNSARTVYPRACGATDNEMVLSKSLEGLSPRMRGNLNHSRRAPAACRSIPAHAGQPASQRRPAQAQPVYPRACGATPRPALSFSPSCGLSPRMRGNRVCGEACAKRLGSIPAHAGQPRGACPSAGRREVYPRACGATLISPSSSISTIGLSPRMRGNPNPSYLSVLTKGSIPAHAGQPYDADPTAGSLTVYPRACGATFPQETAQAETRGLSPRMRGNPVHYRAGRQRGGSIPAHAGQPRFTQSCHFTREVYPRACGATRRTQATRACARGLSPRMRGNRTRRCPFSVHSRSIPAHAGQPRHAYSAKEAGEVYPRACGATWLFNVMDSKTRGLSPRMRGNPVRGSRDVSAGGSIPAHAGQPARPVGHLVAQRVYPRACGATCHCQHLQRQWSGLSPRMRGNPDRLWTQR